MDDPKDTRIAESELTIEAPPQPAPGRKPRNTGAGPAKKGKGAASKPELSPEIVAAATAGWKDILGMAFIGVQMFAPPPFAPSDEEAQGIQQPLSNILGRHFPLPEVTADSKDAFALVIAVSSYGARVFAQLSARDAATVPPPPPPPAASRATVHTPPPPPAPANGEIRAAQPGEATGVPPSELVGPPDEVLAKLHAASSVAG